MATINGIPVGFIAIKHFPHPCVKNLKKVHRLVVLPDYQGVGIGLSLLEFVGKIYLNQKNRYIITTSAPALMNSLKNRKNWKLIRIGRTTPNKSMSSLNKSISSKRITASYELINKPS